MREVREKAKLNRSVDIAIASAEARSRLFREFFPNAGPDEYDRLSALLPTNVPPHFFVGANERAATNMGPGSGLLGVFDFYQHVRAGGPWDPKATGNVIGEDWAAFGNWHFMDMALSAGFPAETARRMAGWAQRQAGTSRPEWGGPLGAFPYGDDPADQGEMTKAHMAWLERELRSRRYELLSADELRLPWPEFDIGGYDDPTGSDDPDTDTSDNGPTNPGGDYLGNDSDPAGSDAYGDRVVLP